MYFFCGDIDQLGRVFVTQTRNMFGLRSLVKRFREFGCSDQMWTEVCDRLRLVSRWQIVKSNRSFFNDLWKHDGMIRIQVHIPSLLLELTSKVLFCQKCNHTLRNVDDWTRHKLKTIFWLRSHFHVAMPSCFWSKFDVGNKFLFVFAKTHPWF